MEKKLIFFLFNSGKNRKLLFSGYTKYITSHVLYISAISRVRNTSKITDIFNTFDKIYLIFTSKNILNALLYFSGDCPAGCPAITTKYPVTGYAVVSKSSFMIDILCVLF